MKRIIVSLITALLAICAYSQEESMTPEQFKELKALAKKKDADAQYTLGMCYLNGNGVKKDEKKAVEWFQKAAEQDHKDAQCQLGICYLNFIGIKKYDPEKGTGWLKKSQTPEAMYQMGLYHDDKARRSSGADKKLNYVESFHWYEKAAQYDHPKACYEVGRAYEGGWGPNVDKAKAIEWITKASDLGYPAAQNNLGYKYQKGIGVKTDGVKALELYEKAASAGYLKAAFNAAYCYEFGIGTPEDEAEAARRYEAIQQNDISAKLRLGYLLEDGNGVEKDEKRAFQLYCEASEKDNANGLYHVGRCYEDGIGVKANKGKALKYYKEAAEQGAAKAPLAYKLLKDSDKLKPKKKGDDLIRTEKMVEDLWKVLSPDQSKPRYLYDYYSMHYTCEAFLKGLPEKYQSTLESELLACYKEVFVVKDTPQWYYVVDDDDNVGIVDLNGELFCLPIPGKIRMMLGGFHFMLLGDETPDDVFSNQVPHFVSTGLGTPVGFGKAVVNWKKSEYIVPLGAYASVSFSRRGTINHYYVSQIVDGSLRWGLLDHKAKVEIPVQYTGVGVEGGHMTTMGSIMLLGGDYVGRNDKTIEEMATDNYQRYYDRVQFAQELGSALMSLGNSMLAVAEAMPDSPGSSYQSDSQAGSISSSGVGSGGRKAKKPEEIIGSKTGVHNMHELQNHQTAQKVYSQCEQELSHMCTFRDYYSESARKEFQRQMKSIRQEQESKGRKMRYSKWEDWDGGAAPSNP